MYFWPHPKRNLAELRRVLKPNGNILIAYRPSASMRKLPFTNHSFTIYDQDKVEVLLKQGGFHTVQTKTMKEPEIAFNDDFYEIEGNYTSGIK